MKMNEADLYNLYNRNCYNCGKRAEELFLILINLLLEKKVISKRDYNKLIKYETKKDKSKREKTT